MQLAASEAREEKLAEELSNARQLLRMVRQQWQPQTWFVCSEFCVAVLYYYY